VILKSHLCGIAVAYDQKGDEKKQNYSGIFSGQQFDTTGRPQGSLYSQQKRKIADACEYMRCKPTHKPIIFVATSPGFTDLANEKHLIKKLTHNLRNGYDCKNYVWVREFTQAGFPHFHFVADMPAFDCVSLSRYWSSLFDSDALNSIRLGTAPRNGKRQYYLKHKRMSWYMTKYLGKSIGKPETTALKFKREFRTFAVSQELAKLSAPKIYESWDQVTEVYRQGSRAVAKHIKERSWIDADHGELIKDSTLLKNWNWKYTGFSNTFKGFPREWKIK